MANKRNKILENYKARREEDLSIARDVVWYKKLTEVVPYVERTEPVENPFKDLLKSWRHPEPGAISSDDQAETD